VTSGARDDPEALDRALHEALAEVGEPATAAPLDAAGARWLRLGLRVGLGRPALAGRLLELMEPGTDDDPRHGDLAGNVDADSDPRARARRAVSALLARSAAMLPAQRREVGPEVAFAWATQLRAAEVLALGRSVQEQLAAGSSADLGRAYGIAWEEGGRIPVDEREALMGDFVALQEAIGSALAGRDLREAEPAPATLGLVGAVDRWIRGARPTPSPAASMVAQQGDLGRLGLIAAWNAWAALRYRALIPAPTFELLVQPWITVVGALDDPSS
jgi:hypothetical protein